MFRPSKQLLISPYRDKIHPMAAHLCLVAEKLSNIYYIIYIILSNVKEGCKKDSVNMMVNSITDATLKQYQSILKC